MSYEVSEIMFAGALLFEVDELKAAAQSKESLVAFIPKLKERAEKSVQFGNDSIKKGFIGVITKDSINDLAIGISAALGVKKHALSMERKYIPTVFMTGNVWPKQVEKFRVSTPNFSDYNSADIMFTYDGARYYGASLKKKPNKNAGDPTMINKVFDSLLEGDRFDKVKDELYQARVNYFSDLVIEAVGKGILRKDHIKDFDNLKKTYQGRVELFEAKKRDKKYFDRAYINVEGYADAKSGGYANKNTKDPNSMRYFVNKKLANSDNDLYTKLVSIMNKYSELFATSLIDVILKTNLYKHIDAKELEHYKFKFYLVTGIGNVLTNSVSIYPATIISLDNTLTVLEMLNDEYGKYPYKIVLDKKRNAESDAATIFCYLQKGDYKLLDIKIRYKGNFTGQPYFTAFLADKFKRDLTVK